MTDTVRSKLISHIIKNTVDSGYGEEELKVRLKVCLNEYDKYNQTTQPVTLEQYIKHLLKQYEKEPSYSLEDSIDKAKDYLELHKKN